MALDPSIALQVKQPQFENPLSQMAQFSQIQGLQNQNQLAQYGLAKAKRDDEDTTAVRNLLTSTPGDLNAKYNALMNGGFHQQAMALKKSQLEQDEKQSVIGKNNADAGKKVQETSEAKRQQAVQDMASFETPSDALASLQHHAAKGDIDPQQAQLMARNIPTDPAQFAQWQVGMLRKLMAPKDQVALTTPDANAQLSANTSLATTGMTTAQSERNSVRTTDQAERSSVRSNERALEINDAKREENRLKAAEGKAPPAEYAKQSEAYLNMGDALTTYKEKLKNFGAMSYLSPSDRSDLGTSYQNVLLQAKELYRLGVLNGPDEGILKTIITNPLEWKNGALPKEAMLKQAEQLEGIVTNSSKNLAKVYGRPVIPLNSQATPAQQVKDAVDNGEVKKLVNARPVSVKSAADYAKLPSGTVYTAPDGSMRTKS